MFVKPKTQYDKIGPRYDRINFEKHFFRCWNFSIFRTNKNIIYQLVLKIFFIYSTLSVITPLVYIGVNIDCGDKKITNKAKR